MANALGGVDYEGDEFREAHVIDVTLTQAIIFMIATPISTVDVPIDLSTSSIVQQKKPDKPRWVLVSA